MNNSLTTSSADESARRLLDWCFSTRPQADDWQAVLARPEALDLDALVAELVALGPDNKKESLDKTLQVWRLQQRIRLAARQRKRLPLVARFTCAQCGVHPTDPTLKICLHCADLNQQQGSWGSRGACQFLRPAYDPIRSCWALLSYRSYLSSNSRSPILLYAATGYADFAAANAALFPLSNYARLIQVGSSRYHDIFSVFKYMDLVEMALPMNPEQWSEFCRTQILRHHARHDPHSLQGILSEALRRIEDDEERAKVGSDG